MSVVPWELEPELRAAGWLHGRRVPVDPAVPARHPAHAVLAELGGLRLMVDYGGYKVCEVEFQPLPEKCDIVTQWELALGTELVGIAEHHNGHGELRMADTGFVFGNSIIHPAFWLVGESLAVALANLLAKRRGRPMLLRQEETVMLYGREYEWDDPEVIRPSSPELRRR